MSEKLKELLGEELYGQVTSKIGDKKIDFLDGYIPKSRFDEKVQEVNTLKEQIGSLESSSTEVDKLLKDNKDVKAAYEKIKNESEQQKQQFELKLNNLNKQTLLKEELQNAGIANTKYTNLLMREVDLGNVEVKDGKLRHHEEVINTLKETYGEMFKETRIEGTQPTQSGIQMTQQAQQQQQGNDIMKNGSLKDRIAFLNKTLHQQNE